MTNICLTTNLNQMNKNPNPKKVAVKRFIPSSAERKPNPVKPKQPSSRPNPFQLRQNIMKRQKPMVSHVLHDIRKYQDSTDMLIPKANFKRLVTEICREDLQLDVRWTSLSLLALQTSAEAYLVGMFEDSYLCALHAKRVTLFNQDLQLARRIRGLGDPGNK